MKLRLHGSLILTVLGLLIFCSHAYSHPHVFVINRLTIVFDEQGLLGIRVKWDFDEMFSSMIAGDYDSNHSGKLEPSEIALIRKEAFSNLAKYDYFTFITLNEKPFKVATVTNFTATLLEGKLSYEFFVPCEWKATTDLQEIRLAQYDPTYYSSVEFGKADPVVIKTEADIDAHFQIAKNMNESYYFDQMHPVEVILLFRLKK